MTHGEKKIAKIIEELTMFFFAIGAKKMQSGIEIMDNQAVIKFQADYDKDNKYKVEKLEEYFNEPKNEGIEDFYWELAGSGDPGETSQLILLGMMVDKAEISIGDEEATMILYRELEDDIY